jgi:hypothetical protein
MAWNKKNDPTASSRPADKREQAKVVPTTGKSEAIKPLSALAQRLGALEESLTVVASEIGISGLPQFKHLEPEKVYQEAVRQAREATRQTQQEIDDRSREAAAAVAIFNVRLDGELRALADRLDDIETRLETLLRQIEAVGRHNQQKRGEAEAIEALQQRLNALEMQLRAQPKRDTAISDQLQQRLAALETQVADRHTGAASEWPFAEADEAAEGVTPTPTGGTDLAALKSQLEAELDRALDALELRLVAKLDERLRQAEQSSSLGSSNNFLPEPAPAYVAAADVKGLQELIAAELAVLLSRRAERKGQLPLLAEPDADLNPLVINATERAIVRLTHRIEKLEAAGGGKTAAGTSRGEARPSRGLVSRLFET